VGNKEGETSEVGFNSIVVEIVATVPGQPGYGEREKLKVYELLRNLVKMAAAVARPRIHHAHH
jgi:hypothetical protein